MYKKLIFNLNLNLRIVAFLEANHLNMKLNINKIFLVLENTIQHYQIIPKESGKMI